MTDCFMGAWGGAQMDPTREGRSKTGWIPAFAGKRRVRRGKRGEGWVILVVRIFGKG